MYAVPGLDGISSPLQGNKTRSPPIARLGETLDRSIARRLSSRCPLVCHLNVLIQVNVSGEATKSGVAPEEIAVLAEALAGLPRLRLRGLMAIPAPESPVGLAQMNQLFQSLRSRFGFDTLSMGMSDDLEAAIAQGSTMVRIGTAIFGKRKTEKAAA